MFERQFCMKGWTIVEIVEELCCLTSDPTSILHDLARSSRTPRAQSVKRLRKSAWKFRWNSCRVQDDPRWSKLHSLTGTKVATPPSTHIQTWRCVKIQGTPQILVIFRDPVSIRSHLRLHEENNGQYPLDAMGFTVLMEKLAGQLADTHRRHFCVKLWERNKEVPMLRKTERKEPRWTK